MKNEILNNEYSLILFDKDIKNGFKHIARIFENGKEIGFVKCEYLNRTWEAYEYQTVILKAIKEFINEPLQSELLEKYRKKLYI
jgi:hypothetical protein